MLKTIALFVSFLLFPLTVCADTVTSYDVSGDVTLAGNVNCPTCSESVGFSFGFDWTPEPNGFGGTWYTASIVNMETNWSGQMATAAGAPGTLGAFYIPLFDSHGDEVDLGIQGGLDFPWAVPPAPEIQGSWLWGCTAATCINDFAPPWYVAAYGPPPITGIYEGEALSDLSVKAGGSPPVHTPEPSTMAMIAAGLLLMAGASFNMKLRGVRA